MLYYRNLRREEEENKQSWSDINTNPLGDFFIANQCVPTSVKKCDNIDTCTSVLIKGKLKGHWSTNFTSKYITALVVQYSNISTIQGMITSRGPSPAKCNHII